MVGIFGFDFEIFKERTSSMEFYGLIIEGIKSSRQCESDDRKKRNIKISKSDIRLLPVAILLIGGQRIMTLLKIRY